MTFYITGVLDYQLDRAVYVIFVLYIYRLFA